MYCDECNQVCAFCAGTYVALRAENDRLRGLLHSEVICEMHYCELHEMAFQRGVSAPARCPYCENGRLRASGLRFWDLLLLDGKKVSNPAWLEFRDAMAAPSEDTKGDER